MPVVEGPVQPSRENVINLMDALRRSMESERPLRAKPPERRNATAAKPAPGKRPKRSER
jgi:DNA end-binding protein Ku